MFKLKSSEGVSRVTGFIEAAAIYAGVPGLATGGASLASRFPLKLASITGSVAGALVLEIGLIFLLRSR